MELNYSRGVNGKYNLRARQIGDCIGQIFVPWQIFDVIQIRAKPVENTRKLKLMPWEDARACSSRARSICFTRKCTPEYGRIRGPSSFRILAKWRGEYREIMYHPGNRCSCIFCSFCEEKHVLRLTTSNPHTLWTRCTDFTSVMFPFLSRYHRYFTYKQFS